MSTTNRPATVAAGCVGLALTGTAFAGNLRWMDGEFRVGDPYTRADQLAKSTILGIQGLALIGCCLLALAIWRWRRDSAPGALRVTGLLLEGVGGAGFLAALGGVITNGRGSLGDELDALGATVVIVLGIAVAIIAGGLGAWAVRSAGYREARTAAEAEAMGLAPPPRPRAH